MALHLSQIITLRSYPQKITPAAFRFLRAMPFSSRAGVGHAALLEVVDHDLCPKPLALFDELQVQRMSLISVLSLFRLKLDVQADLVTLINHRAMAGNHLTGMKIDNARNGSEVFCCARKQFIRGIG
jgi:hypothetical protein